MTSQDFEGLFWHRVSRRTQNSEKFPFEKHCFLFSLMYIILRQMIVTLWGTNSSNRLLIWKQLPKNAMELFWLKNLIEEKEMIEKSWHFSGKHSPPKHSPLLTEDQVDCQPATLAYSCFFFGGGVRHLLPNHSPCLPEQPLIQAESLCWISGQYWSPESLSPIGQRFSTRQETTPATRNAISYLHRGPLVNHSPHSLKEETETNGEHNH